MIKKRQIKKNSIKVNEELTDNENFARSGIRANGVCEVYRVRSGVRSFCFLVYELRSYIGRFEFDPFAREYFLPVDGPARSRLGIGCVGHRDGERFSSDHSHIADAEIARDLWRDYNKTIDI